MSEKMKLYNLIYKQISRNDKVEVSNGIILYDRTYSDLPFYSLEKASEFMTDLPLNIYLDISCCATHSVFGGTDKALSFTMEYIEEDTDEHYFERLDAYIYEVELDLNEFICELGKRELDDKRKS